MTELKGKRERIYTKRRPEYILHIVEVSKEIGLNNAARKFNILNSTIANWKRNEERIYKQYQSMKGSDALSIEEIKKVGHEYEVQTEVCG